MDNSIKNSMPYINPTVKTNSSTQVSFAKKNKTNSLERQPSGDCVELHVKEGMLRDSIQGSLFGEESNITVKGGMITRTLSGNIGDGNFEIIDKSRSTKGNFAGKEIDLKKKSNGMLKDSYTTTGTIGGKEVNLKVTGSIGAKEIKGVFEDKPLDIVITSNLSTMMVKGEYNGKKIDLDLKDNGFFKNGFDITGTFKNQKDLFPFILSYCYDKQQNDQAAAIMIMS